MIDMTESTKLLAFKRQKDGYKFTVKISLCICAVLSWDELKVRQNLLVCLLVATVYFFVKKSNITLTLFIYDFISCFDYYITLGYYFLPGSQVLRCVFPYPIFIIS